MKGNTKGASIQLHKCHKKSYYEDNLTAKLFLFFFLLKCFPSNSSNKKKSNLSPPPLPQGHRSLTLSQPPGAGHPQCLSHVRQYGLDRPVAPRGRRSHGGLARGSHGLRAGAKRARSGRTERTGHLKRTGSDTLKTYRWGRECLCKKNKKYLYSVHNQQANILPDRDELARFPNSSSRVN